MKITSGAKASFAAMLSLLAIGGMMPRASSADTMQTTKEVTTMSSSSGTVTEFAPSSSTIVVKSESSPEPLRYRFTEKTTFVDPAGQIVSRETIRNQPVTVFYSQDGDQMVVNRVVVSKPSIEKKSTTTTTTEEVH